MRMIGRCCLPCAGRGMGPYLILTDDDGPCRMGHTLLLLHPFAHTSPRPCTTHSNHPDLDRVDWHYVKA